MRFFREHEHEWKMGTATMSMTPGYDDKTQIERCTKGKCKAVRTVYTHKCSECGHVDKKHSFVIGG